MTPPSAIIRSQENSRSILLLAAKSSDYSPSRSRSNVFALFLYSSASASRRCLSPSRDLSSSSSAAFFPSAVRFALAEAAALD